MRKIDRTGETRMMNCGTKAIIVDYNGYNDINILFTNNVLVLHTTYKVFCEGKMNPDHSFYKYKTQLTKEEADKLRASLPLQTS